MNETGQARSCDSEERIKRLWVEHQGAILCFLLAAFLLTFRLHNGRLWEDEAETAVPARNILTCGYPSAWDGVNLVTQEFGFDSNENRVWTWSPWAQHYLASLSFLLLGPSTASARLPFALVGLLTIILCYFLTLRYTGNKEVALLTTAFLTTSVPFLLFCRQCRYYSLVAFATVLMTYFYLGLQQNDTPRTRISGALGFSLAGSLLFHSNYLVFIGALLGFGVHYVLFGSWRGKELVLLGLAIAFIGLMTYPWAVYAGLFRKFGIQTGIPFNSDGLLRFMACLTEVYQFVYIFIDPILLLGCVRLLTVGVSPLSNSSGLYTLSVTLVLTHAFFIAYTRSQGVPLFDRYFVGLIPFVSVLTAALIVSLHQALNRFVIRLLVTAYLLTNLFSLPLVTLIGYAFPGRLQRLQPEHLQSRCYLADFIYEITHRYTGPIDRIVDYLRKRAQPGDTLFIGYEAEPIIFYFSTSLKIVREAPFPHPPRWIVPRDSFYGGAFEGALTKMFDTNYTRQTYIPSWLRGPSSHELNQYLFQFIKQHPYKRIDLGGCDLPWQNRESIFSHHFHSPDTGPPLVIYELVEKMKE